MTKAQSTRCPIAVFASGNGSNFQALLDACASGHITGEIRVLCCDRSDAFAIERAQQAGIPVELIPRSKDRSADGRAILEQLAPYQVKLICLAGYMRILDPHVIQAYPNRILNIHPSLLPLYPGLHAVRQALAAGASESGCTVHFVDAGVDTGPVIAQERVAVLPDDTEESLHQRIHALEHELYPRAVQQVITEI